MQRIQNKTKIHGFVKMAIFAFLAVGFAILGQAKVAHAAPANIKTYLKTAPITVIFEGSRWTANAAEIRKWLTVQNNGIVTAVNPEKFVNLIANQINIDPTEDQDGRRVDTNALTSKINEILTQGLPGKTIDLPLITISRNVNAQAGRYEGRYIDINLSEQTLYAFEGYNLANQFLVSTGRRGHATPTGEFHIYSQDWSARMHGPGYYLPNVPFISWFYGDYSIHGTYWHNNFGHVMSHGCVNMETGAAEWIFGWAGIGTPVYIHY